MSDEDVQRAIRTIERHGQQAHIIQSLLPSIPSDKLLEIKALADHLQNARLTEIRYCITAPGKGEPVEKGGSMLHMDLYANLQDVFFRWVVPRHPALLASDNVRYTAYYQSYGADPNKEFNGEPPLARGCYHIEIHVKRYHDSNGYTLK